MDKNIKYYFGTNVVVESLNNKRAERIVLIEDFNNPRVIELAKREKVSLTYLPKGEFVKKYKGNTQGCVVYLKPFKTFNLEEVLKSSKEKKDSVLVLLDELQDPHNLGAILRSADVFNADAVIYKKHNSVSLSETVARVSAGAINYVKCVEVVNLTQTINKLKENGYWVIGLDGDAKGDLSSIPSDAKIAFVVGSEGYGISALVKKNCDMLAKIPMNGHVSCLNASVSCAIALYHVRNFK